MTYPDLSQVVGSHNQHHSLEHTDKKLESVLFVFVLCPGIYEEGAPSLAGEPLMKGLVRNWVWGSVSGRISWNFIIATLLL